MHRTCVYCLLALAAAFVTAVAATPAQAVPSPRPPTTVRWPSTSGPHRTTTTTTEPTTTTTIHHHHPTTTTTAPPETTTTAAPPPTTATTVPSPVTVPPTVVQPAPTTTPPTSAAPPVTQPATTTTTTAAAAVPVTTPPTQQAQPRIVAAAPSGPPPPGPGGHPATPTTLGFPRTIIMASGAGSGPSLLAATDLGVPIVFGALVALFLLGQGVLGRRDPRLVEAPAHGDDDSIPFE